MTEPTRPIVRYHGGKWLLAPWVVSFFPAHKTYVEPFGGGGSVLLRKPRSCAEIYNDIDGEIVNVFRVLRDPAAAERLRRDATLTPFSRVEFNDAYEPTEDHVERARRILIRSHMGFGSAGATRDHRTGFRANINNANTTAADDWAGWPDGVASYVNRLRGVVIEHCDAAALFARYDGPDTLLYLDPPYAFSTRQFPRGAAQPFAYRHEMTDDDHRAMAEAAHAFSGMIVLSGYPSDLYDRELFSGWERHERVALGDTRFGGSERTEVVWLNPACSAAVRAQRQQGGLFDVA